MMIYSIVISIIALQFLTVSCAEDQNHLSNSGDKFRTNLTGYTFFNHQFRDELYSEKNLDIMRVIYDPEKFSNDSEFIKNSLKNTVMQRTQAAVYKILLLHRYDKNEDLIKSGGPTTNQAQCLDQLSKMVERFSNVRNTSYYGDLNARLLMDTYGRVPAGIRGGYLTWAGRYLDCKNFKLSVDGSAIKQEMRYCFASMKNPNWSNASFLDEVWAVETAVCLPKSCDSLDYLEKYKLIEQLIHLNDGEFVARGLNISSLYCLPDEQSELRQWWKSPITKVLINMSIIWFCTIAFATLVYEMRSLDDVSLPSDSKYSNQPSIISRVITGLAITRNFRLLFNTSQRPSISESEQFDADLRPIDGIKVVCMIYIITGHCLSCFSMLLKNAQDHVIEASLAYYLPYLVPAFAVNGFFVITGILTSYLIFKHNRGGAFLSKPVNWIMLVIHRYLRVMPAYLVVALFAKHVGRYIGSGPFWDYGTSSLSHRWLYENEPISWTLLFGANLKFIQDHCITSAWYLANDFQFFLVTPIFITLLNKSPTFGKTFISFCILLGTVATSFNVWTYDIDFRPIANFELHSMMYLIAYLNSPYVSPIYRIPSYLLGLLFGYNLYKYVESERKSIDNKLESSNNYKWSKMFVKCGPTISLLLIVIQCVSPFISSRVTFTKLSAQMGYSILMPFGHLIFAWSIGSYVLLAATGYGNKFINNFLSLSIWKILARLSLCAFLVQMEVIFYFTQTTTEMQDLVTPTFIAFVILCTIVTYIVATAVYVVFEAPFKNCLSILMSFVTSSSSSSSSTSSTQKTCQKNELN